MVEGALNAAAEQIVEWSAHGFEMQREGNRTPYAAPQGLYPCTGWENWLSLSCETDEQWQGLRKALGEPEWAADPGFDTHAGRRARHDELDERLRAWAAERDIDTAVEHLVSHGVPAAPARDPRLNASQPQLVARAFEEPVEHPIVGTHPLPRPPFTYSHVDRWVRTRAPLMGEHSREILAELGYTDEDLDRFEAEAVIGYKPAGY
jgi:crotonobetainyl-CoA:carnitine CoA-transferase CaiB-like acyl-CoA transferase